MAERDQGVAPIPESRAVRQERRRPSLIWIVPLFAALVGAWVAVTRILSEGPEITIVLPTAEGLEAGKTKLRYNGVEIGTVAKIHLTDDHRAVVATARMEPDTEAFLVDDTKLWVVRAEVSGANITGLGTLISGSYIGMEIGASTNPRRKFVAETRPPVISRADPGRYFVLKTPDLGSLDRGTPIFFRRMDVGEVTSFELDPDGRSLTVDVFVNAPYDQYVNPNTRFWHASGVDLSLSATGVSLDTQSVLSMIVGGIAFETPVIGPALPAAEARHTFALFKSRAEAFKLGAVDPQTYVLVFTESVRGLSPGAPVEFRGIPIGEVIAIDAQLDAQTGQLSTPVTIVLDPQSLGVKFVDIDPSADRMAVRRKLIEHLVSHGVRAQLQTGNLLTGARFVTLDFFPDAPPVTIDWTQQPVYLPTAPGDLEAVEASLTSLLKKFDAFPIEALGADIRKAMADLDHVLVSARGALDNAGSLVGPDSELSADLRSSLGEVGRAARSLRVLADYLEQHPEALIRGKTEAGQ